MEKCSYLANVFSGRYELFEKMKLLVTALISILIYGFSKMADKVINKIPSSVLNWKDKVWTISRETGVPKELIQAVIWTESAGDPDAVGSAGEIGLMQLKPIAVTDVNAFYPVNTRNWRTDPVVNILTGAYFLKLQHRRTGSWPEAIKAYNQGVKGAKENPDLANEYYFKVKQRMEMLV